MTLVAAPARVIARRRLDVASGMTFARVVNVLNIITLLGRR